MILAIFLLASSTESLKFIIYGNFSFAIHFAFIVFVESVLRHVKTNYLYHCGSDGFFLCQRSICMKLLINDSPFDISKCAICDERWQLITTPSPPVVFEGRFDFQNSLKRWRLICNSELHFRESFIYGFIGKKFL